MRRIAPLAALCLGPGVLHRRYWRARTGGRSSLTPVAARYTSPTIPSPFDSVASVNIYIDSIEASTAHSDSGLGHRLLEARS